MLPIKELKDLEKQKLRAHEAADNLIELLQRKSTWSFMEPLFTKRRAEVLELNCGSGDDTFWMASYCYSITATDQSGELITLAESKKILKGVKNVAFEECGLFDLRKKLLGQQYDFIYSGCGGLNYYNEPELETLSKDFAELLYPGGKMLVVVKGKYCLWETLYFLKKLKLVNALKRWDNKAVHENVDEGMVERWYYSVKNLEKIFRPHFSLVGANSIGVATPPAFMNDYFKHKQSRLNRLNQIDNLLTRFNILSNFGDFTMLTFERKDSLKNKKSQG